jgi:murein DD-endopeptidase MepM/ murein hydrolase activator NlpD
MPGEGLFAVLAMEPQGAGLPVFEVSGRASDRELKFASAGGGAYVGLVAAPLNTDEVSVEIVITFIDGTRVTQELALLVTRRDFPSSRLRVAPRYTRPDSATLVRVAREQAAVRAMQRTVTPAPLWDGPFELPLRGVTTSPYGQRRLFNNELRSRHTGLDIDGDTGDPVYAANSGRIAMSADLFYNGGAVFIDHGLGLYTGYFHLSARDVVQGQWVEKGDVIGRVGATGRVTGPHLHWHMYLQGFSLDPRSLLDPDFVQTSARLPTYSPLSVEP